MAHSDEPIDAARDHLHPASATKGHSPTLAATLTAATTQASGDDRRRAPRRRLRDRIASLDSTESPSLRGRHELANLMLLVDDDLRQTALALGAVERFLARSIELLEQRQVDGRALADHAASDEVADQLERLGENVDGLRDRMAGIAGRIVRPER